MEEAKRSVHAKNTRDFLPFCFMRAFNAGQNNVREGSVRRWDGSEGACTHIRIQFKISKKEKKKKKKKKKEE